MAVYKIIECDICGKKDNFDSPLREKWFIENICHTICSYECFQKSITNSKRKLKSRKDKNL
jgi:hypothetical protein